MSTSVLDRLIYLEKVMTSLKEKPGLQLRKGFNIILTCYDYAESKLLVMKTVCHTELKIISGIGRNLTT